MNKKIPSILKSLLRLLPVAAMCCFAIIIMSNSRLNIETIINSAPHNILLAVLFIFLMYAAKSCSIVFPIKLIQAASGLIFPLPVAILVNSVGGIITFSLQYLIGHYSGNSLEKKLINKYPKLALFVDNQHKYGITFPMMLRLAGLPCDIVGMYFGATIYPFFLYISGSFLGTCVGMVLATVIGNTISSPTSPAFIISLSLNFLLTGTVFVVFAVKRLRRKQNRDDNLNNK